MKRRIPALALALALLLSGCAAQAAPAEGPRRFEASFLTLFDTVTTIVGYGETEEDFRQTAQQHHHLSKHSVKGNEVVTSAGVFTIAKVWSQPECPSPGEWSFNIACNTVACYSAIKMG